MKHAFGLTLVMVLSVGCPAEDSDDEDTGADAANTLDEGGGTSNGTATATTASASDPSNPTTVDPATSEGPGATCELTEIVPSPGLESCFECMSAMCCAQLQVCDATQRCLDCLADPLDTEACVDPVTFQSYPEFADMVACQTQLCVPPCGIDGGSSCTPADCAPECSNYGSGCA